jgi:hypothetical protein
MRAVPKRMMSSRRCRRYAGQMRRWVEQRSQFWERERCMRWRYALRPVCPVRSPVAGSGDSRGRLPVIVEKLSRHLVRALCIMAEASSSMHWCLWPANSCVAEQVMRPNRYHATSFCCPEFPPSPWMRCSEGILQEVASIRQFWGRIHRARH